MRKLFLSLVIMLLVFSSSGQVVEHIDVNKDRVKINTTVTLTCDENSGERCPVNKWRLKWQKPEGAEIIKITDTKGEITDYTVEGEKVSVTTNSGSLSTSETIKVLMWIEEDAEEIHNGLYKTQFSLPAFEGREHIGAVHVEDLLSGRVSYGFDSVYSKEYLNFSGKGPIAVRIKFGEGNQDKYYEFFGSEPKNNTELAYEVAVGMTGQVQGFKRFPVAVIPSEKFNRTVASWSSGEYIGGSIKIRDGLKEKFLPVLAHETVHGLNDRALNWDQTGSSWFDEGVAKHVEYLVDRKLGNRVPEIFGDSVKYYKKINGTRYEVTIPPKGERERLWEYYNSDRDIMRDWNPKDFPSNRKFGYAYSELIIKNYLVHNNGKISELYQKVDPGRKISSNDEKWAIFSQHLDMTPCKYESRDKFDKCLDEINNYDYKVYRAVSPSPRNDRITVTEKELSKSSKDEKKSNLILENESNGSLSKKSVGSNFSLIDKIYSIINKIKSIFAG